MLKTSKNSINLDSQIGSQLWKTWMMTQISTGLGKVLEYKSFSHREFRILWVETVQTMVWWRVLKALDQWKQAKLQWL